MSKTYSVHAFVAVAVCAFIAGKAHGAVDAQAPTTPSSLSATAISSSQINLSWVASVDAVGVSAYLVERCAGANCATFTQVAVIGATNLGDSGLTGGTTYRYRVRAKDAANNLSPYSSIASTITVAGTGTAGQTTYEYDSFGRLRQVTVVPR